MTIPESVLRAAIEILEGYPSHPSTGPLHDPVYAMLMEPGGSSMDDLAIALEDHTSHPGAEELRALFAGYVRLADLDLDTILMRHGVAVAGVDPIATVDRRLREDTDVRKVLERRITILENDLGHTRRIANGLAAAGAMVAVFGILGWLIALGALEIEWIDPPVPSDMQSAAAGRGSVGSAERDVR